MIFTNIEIRGRLESPLKIKRVFRDISIRFEDADCKNRGFRPKL
jgi:hypothetical protein